VMVFGDAIDDFGIVVGGSVGALLASKGNEDTGIIVARGRQLIRQLSCSHFDARPFPPQINACGGFNDIGNVGAPDASGDFEEIKLSVGVCFQKFGVCDSSKEAQLIENFSIHFEECFSVDGIARKCARGEYAALVRSLQRRRAVRVSLREDNLAFGSHAIDMIDAAGNELFEQIVRLMVAKLIEPGPELGGLVNLFHADAGGLRARLEQPRGGDAGHELAQGVVIENGNEVWDGDACFFCPGAHGEFVSEITDGGQAHAGDAHVFTEGRNVFHVEFVEGDDAIDGLRSGDEADGVDELLHRKFFWHEEHFVDGLAWPIRVAKFFDSQEDNAAANRFAGAQKFLTFFVRADTEDGERTALGHR
jgi:hypothetical protein